jgi:hypothetical protein
MLTSSNPRPQGKEAYRSQDVKRLEALTHCCNSKLMQGSTNKMSEKPTERPGGGVEGGNDAWRGITNLLGMPLFAWIGVSEHSNFQYQMESLEWYRRGTALTTCQDHDPMHSVTRTSGGTPSAARTFCTISVLRMRVSYLRERAVRTWYQASIMRTVFPHHHNRLFRIQHKFTQEN